MFHARTAERPTGPVGQAAKTPPSHGGNGGSIPPRVRKKHAEACFFQRNKSTAWICEIHRACEIRLRRVKCLRAWEGFPETSLRVLGVPVGGFISFHIRREPNISHFPSGKYFTSRGAGYFTKNPTGYPSGFHLFSFLFSLLSSLKKPRQSEVFSSNPSLQAAPICDILYNVKNIRG